jgi:DNA-binding HxlR family transcriptional regulator
MKLHHSTPLEPKVGCISAALSVLGQKWTALIIRDLYSGPKGFCELERTVEGINPRTLSQRLDELEKFEIIQKYACEGAPNRCEYHLAHKGRDLVPVLRHMAEWGEKYPTQQTT